MPAMVGGFFRKGMKMSLTEFGPDVIAQKLYRYDRVHTALPGVEAFGEAQVKEYLERGFVAIENVFTPEEVATYGQALTDLIAQGDPRIVQFEEAGMGKNLSPLEREGYVRKCNRFVEFEPRLKGMSRHPKLIGIAEKLVGETVRLVQDIALLKPAKVGREKPWHQDMAYFDVKPFERVIGTWTAIDRATEENGCMHVIPGSHRLGPKAHYHDRDCQLKDEDVRVEEDVVVPLKPGGVLFFSALLHHGTPPNRSEMRRRAVQLHYCGVSCEKLSVEEHAAAFRDEEGYAGCAGYRYGSHPPRKIGGRVREV
jgi:phytanoyl-CoA hydroxylase